MKTTHPINPLRNFLKLHASRTADADCQRLRKPSQALRVLKSILKTTAWMLALTSLTCWNATAQNLVSNPGFESGAPSAYLYSPGSTDLPGWTVNTTPSDGVQLFLASGFFLTQTPDTQVLQLTGFNDVYANGGGVQQSIATTPGVTYTISIDVISRNGNSVTGNFSFGGQDHAITASSQTFTTLAWTKTATSASTLIDITGSASSGSVQLIIDNVSVTLPSAVASAANSSVTAAPESVPADGTSTSTITVTLLDASNNPLAGKFVTLAKTAGPGTITSTNPQVTSGLGEATFTVSSNTAGAAVFTATVVTDGNLAIAETANVTFVTPAPITWGAPTIIAGDTDVSTTGTLRYAYHWANNGDQIVNGVYFFATTSFTSGGGDVGLAGFAQQADFFNSSSAPFIDLSGPYKSILAGSAVNYTGSPVNITVTLQNLTLGIQYAVQVWSQNPRGDTEPQLSTTLASFGGNSVVLDHNSLNADGGVGQYSIGTFTATSTTQTFTLNSIFPMLNAIQVRDLSVVADDYAAWAAGYNLVEGHTGDDDKDGLTNQEEYAFGLVPISGASVNPIVVQLDKTAKTFSYTRRDTDLTAPNLNYSVWFSTDLEGWTEDTGTTEGTPVLTGEVETVQVTLSSLPGDPLPAKLFMQVRASVTQPALYNVVEQGADPTGTTDCTQLLQEIHSRKQQVYYPNGIYRFNGETLDLSGGIQFESPNGVVIRNDISAASVVQFDDQGNLIGLQQNHLEQDDSVLGPQAQMRSGSLVRPPVSTASPAVAVDLIAHWYNDGGLDARRTGYGWPGWYYWTWNFHQPPLYVAAPDPYEPERHPLLGFYRGDDPVVLDWQCYWLAEYGAKAVTLCNVPPLFNEWDQPSSEAHWAYQLFHNVPNFQKLKYIMWPTAAWIAYTPENQASTEADWVSMIDQIYLQYGNFYSIKSGGKVYPVLYVQEGEALRQVFDNSSGSTNTAAFLVRMGNRFKAAGYGGIALFARNPTGDSVMSYSDLERQGVLYLNAAYHEDYGTGSTYPAHVATFAPPADRRRIVSTATSTDSHTPHPSQWVCPGSTPALFKDVVVKAVSHVQANDMLRIVTCYNVAEWAEGGPGLQPNMRDRFGYLQAIKDTVVLPAGTPMQENNVFRPATSLAINYTYATIPTRTDTSWVVPSGYTSVKAMNLGSAISSTFGGVNWLTTNAGTGASYNDAAPISMYYSAPGKAWGTKLTGLYTSSTASLILNDATSSSGLQSGGVDFRLVLGSTGVPSTGFIKGKEYLVQFVFADRRAASKGRKITIEAYSPNIASRNSLPYQFAFGDNRYAVVTARFTPGVGDTEFQFRPLINGGTNGMQLNAIHVLVKNN